MVILLGARSFFSSRVMPFSVIFLFFLAILTGERDS